MQSSDDVEKRLREVTFKGKTRYIFTVFKIMSDGSKRLVSEEQIDRRTYEKLLEFKDEKRNTIHKKRYYFSESGEYFHLDVFDDGTNILELNISEDEKTLLPSNVRILEKVTDDERYLNINMSLKKNEKKLEKK